MKSILKSHQFWLNIGRTPAVTLRPGEASHLRATGTRLQASSGITFSLSYLPCPDFRTRCRFNQTGQLLAAFPGVACQALCHALVSQQRRGASISLSPEKIAI